MTNLSPKMMALLCAVVAMIFSGCGGSFEKNWKSAATSQVGRDSFEGRWDGKWRSQKHRNGEGRLRCILTRAGADRYHARFKADWMIFSSSYELDFQTRRRGNEIVFSGSKNLGPLYGGVYTFEGRATPKQFIANYDSSYDTGTFEMAKLPGASGVTRTPEQ